MQIKRHSVSLKSGSKTGTLELTSVINGCDPLGAASLIACCSIPFRSGPSSSPTVAEKNVLMQDHTDDHEASSKPTVTTALMPSKAPAEPVLYIRRWIILLLFSLVSMMNACTWITFSPFASKAAAFYGVNSLAIDMFSLCFMIVYIPCIFLSSYLIAKYGLRFGVRSNAIYPCSAFPKRFNFH
jgi:hypothetical protein